MASAGPRRGGCAALVGALIAAPVVTGLVATLFINTSHISAEGRASLKLQADLDALGY